VGAVAWIEKDHGVGSGGGAEVGGEFPGNWACDELTMLDRSDCGLADGAIAFDGGWFGEHGGESGGAGESEHLADGGADEEFAADEAGDGVAGESEDECGVCVGAMDSGPEWFSGFEFDAVEELGDVGAAESSGGKVEESNGDASGEQQEIGLECCVDGVVEFVRGVGSGLKADDSGTEILEECGEHGLCGVAEPAWGW
jgi:hypothetical protein